MKRIFSSVGAPVLLMGLLLAGSSGFRGHSASTSSLNTLSDTIRFQGIFDFGGSAFTIHSTSCTATDGAIPMAADGIEGDPCMLAAAGQINLATGTATGTVAISGPDGTIVFQQTGTHGCATGTGFETDPGPIRVPVRIEGISSTYPISAHQLHVTGTILVYEAGGPQAGNNCEQD